MDINQFMKAVDELNINYFCGVPDSQLKALCDFLMERYGISDRHIVAANEGAAVGLAAGHYLVCGNPAMVYMQNSGIGNAVNPICSLLNRKVYEIPVLFVIGWRGEPGVHDEPQHIFQGEITPALLDCLQIPHFVLERETAADDFGQAVENAKDALTSGHCYAFVVKKGVFESEIKVAYQNSHSLIREQIIKTVVEASLNNDIFVSTTGKLSRELFEIREGRQDGHSHDFLTVGSMGHSLMIALGIAKSKPDRRVFCLDGDGAVLMHMGSMAVVGAHHPSNLIHIVINNGAHETVGGIPTVSESISFPNIASACGYRKTFCAETQAQLEEIVKDLTDIHGPVFIEVKANLYSRSDLGRPTTTPIENKEAFMEFIRKDVI